MQTITTERLVLRGFCEADLEQLHAYCIKPDVGSHAGWKPHETIEDSKRILREFITCGYIWAITERKSGRVIGSCGLHPDFKRMNDGARMLGYVLDDTYWGRGYMTEAAMALIRHGFQDMQLDIIGVYHFRDNMRSKRVIEKCGFRYEGVMRQARRLYDGRLVDDVCYSLTREEFLSNRK
ncbi:MAG: GNAT family N-acetyltransferase [Ruminococcaceae bacterium]|nr:GNAT family N-acetyltransferase [Oscillospiraceae bacterium]